MNTFSNVRVRILPNGVWVDIKVNDIAQIHRASLLGGKLVVYQLCEGYKIGFVHEAAGISLNFYGLEITNEQYCFQIRSWGGNCLNVTPGTELLLADNLYFI